jgi:aryl-alcohol dehydrogenase-like predicted oxidoreductase
MNRRDFARVLGAGLAGSVAMSCTETQSGETTPSEDLDRRNERDSMAYRRLGRTNFRSSRLVFGCGAALVGGKAVRLLDRAFEAGINHYDVGTDIYYKGSERALAPFMKAHREEVFIVSKGFLGAARIAPDDPITTETAREAARFWTGLLEGSLRDLDTDFVDAYYLMAVSNPELIRSEELYRAFLDARDAGKVGYWGLSTHKNAKMILEAAIETGWYDLAMVGITPSGWYDWTTRDLEEGTPAMTEIQPLLQRARNAGIGLVGMKAVRYIAPLGSAGKGDESAFDSIYDEPLVSAQLSPFQRAYAYVLEHGVDVVNADMQNYTHLEENIVAAATSHRYFG